MPRTRPPRLDRFVELTIDSIGFEGVSVGRIDGIVHFVKGALPGEHVRARVTRSKKSYVEAEVVDVLAPSQHRLDPPCPHFGACGGCKWQHFDYGEQVRWKRQHVVDAFQRIGQIDVGEIAETMASPAAYGYRNKMEFSFGASRWLTNEEIASGETFETDFALGLHVPGRFDKVRHLDHCLLQAEVGNTVLKATHLLAEQFGVRAYHQRAHEGFLRHLVVRTSATTGAVMTILISAGIANEQEDRFVEAWMALHATLPEGSTMMHAVNITRSPVAVGQIERTIGPAYLTEHSHGVEYRISPFSFFQTNTLQLPNLVGKALEAAHITADDVVWDLYCGTGTLTLPAAKAARHVVGIELVESSIADATANAERNHIENIELHVADLHAPSTITMLRSIVQPSVVMIDPPRAGMHPALVQHVLDVAAPRISYVSCNPATLARDCAMLAEKYDVVRVTPVDMFPQTYHVEAVAELRLRS
jgi:23S rRNA (uracil1939-C5)-methyltransferase